LFGPDIRPLPFVIAIIASQLYIASVQSSWSALTFFLVAWIYGGAASHSLSLMTHELSHNLLFSQIWLNEYFGIVCNIGMGIPSST
jgi:fatty acid desaturase